MNSNNPGAAKAAADITIAPKIAPKPLFDQQKEKGTRIKNGAGTRYQEQSGRCCIQQTLVDSFTGKKFRKKFSGWTRDEAQKRQNDYFAKNSLIRTVNAETNETFSAYANEWLANVEKISLRQTSFARKELTLKYQVCHIIGELKISAIRKPDIQNMIAVLA